MVRPGLCGVCVHARTVRSRRGSVFYLCDLSRTDPAFPRYPALPVFACRGFRPRRAGTVEPEPAEPGGPEKPPTPGGG